MFHFSYTNLKCKGLFRIKLISPTNTRTENGVLNFCVGGTVGGAFHGPLCIVIQMEASVKAAQVYTHVAN